MSDIQVTKKENSWQVVTANGTFTVKDKNENGKIDKEDVWSSANGGALPSDEEIEEAMGLSLKKENMTTEEIAEYNKVQQQLKQKEEYRQQREQQIQQQQQYQTQTQPKQKWWEKAAMIGSAVMMPMSMMMSMFIGSGIGSSYYNSGNCNDRGLQIMGISTAGLMGMSQIAAMIAAMKGLNNPNTYVNPVQNPYRQGTNWGGNNNYGTYLVDAWKSEQESNIAQQTKNEEAAKKAQAKADKEFVQKTINAAASGTNVIKANKDYLDTLKDPDKTRVYTETEINNARQINSTPSIPIHLIDPKGEAKNKLTKGLAENLQTLLTAYDEKSGDLKYDVISKKNHQTIQTLLGKKELTEADVNKLRDIYNKPTEDK